MSVYYDSCKTGYLPNRWLQRPTACQHFHRKVSEVSSAVNLDGGISHFLKEINVWPLVVLLFVEILSGV